MIEQRKPDSDHEKCAVLISDPLNDKSPYSRHALKTKDRFSISDGCIDLIEDQGKLRYRAEGLKAWKTLNSLDKIYGLSPMQIYSLLGGNDANILDRLRSDQRFRVSSGRFVRQTDNDLPDISTIIDEVNNVPIAYFQHAYAMFGGSQQELGIVEGNTCNSAGSQSCAEYFESWFTDLSRLSNPIGFYALDDAGYYGQRGNGTWGNGEANINLLSTPSGAAVVCLCPEEFTAFENRPGLIVQEYVGPVEGPMQGQFWIDIYRDSSMAVNTAFGINFTGYIMRRIRLLVRKQFNTNTPDEFLDFTGREFNWGGSY